MPEGDRAAILAHRRRAAAARGDPDEGRIGRSRSRKSGTMIAQISQVDTLPAPQQRAKLRDRPSNLRDRLLGEREKRE